MENTVKENFFKTYDENKGKLVWRLWFILMVELLGTFAMVFEIIAPNALALGDPNVVGEGFANFYNAVFGTFIMKAFWVTGFIWILIMICGKVSVNLNPAVTLGEVADGKFGWNRGFSMIGIQLLGAIAAAEAAYQIGAIMSANSEFNTTLDAVYPVFQTPWYMGSGLEMGKTNPIWNEGMNVFGSNSATFGQWALAIFPFMIIEFVFTYLLISSVFEGKFGFMGRSFVICIPLTITVALGIFTHNIALNPARLLGPAIIGQMHSAASSHATTATMQFTWIFLLGEILAVMVWFVRCGFKNKTDGTTREDFRREVRLLGSEVLSTRARYQWVLAGNRSLESMNKDELLYAAEFCNVDYSPEETRDDLEYDIIEWIIFELESNKQPPLVVEKVNKTKKAIVKDKKIAPKLSKNEDVKRDAEREKLKAKVAKQTAGKKVSAADLKKMKLTDLYGIGAKREEYFHNNGITDMVKLSNRNIDTLTKKFIEGLPALKSWTFENKKEAIEANISEAKFMVEELTK